MRRSFIVLAIVFVVGYPQDLFGQLGGLRRRAQEMVTPKQEPPKAVQPVPVTITDEVLSRYLRGLAARERALREKARENNDVGRYFAAVARRDSLQRRQNEYRAEQGPDWERAQRLREAMGRGDAAAAQELSRLERSIDPSQVTIPEADWNAQRAGNQEMDSIAIVGSGFDAGQWAFIIDEVPPIVAAMTHDGALSDSLVNGIVAAKQTRTAPQVVAVRARRIELARALLFRYRTDAMIAAELSRQQEAERRQREAEAGPDTRTYNGCMTVAMKTVSDSMTKRQPEIDAASARNDVAKLSEIANQIAAYQQKTTEKCAPLLNQ
jgi:hypothetical protein